MKILVHLRRGERDFYLRLARKAFPGSEVRTISDERSGSAVWIGWFIYGRGQTTYKFAESDRFEIYKRCRFLRGLEYGMASELIGKVAGGLLELLRKERFDLVIGGLVDCYIQDILERLCRLENIVYLSFVGHFFNGYCRISSRGELNVIERNISRTEVDEVLAQVKRMDFKPSFAPNESRIFLARYCNFFKEAVKKNIAFPLLKLMNRDPCNYHYNTTIDDRFRYRMLQKRSVDKYFSRFENLRDIDSGTSIYFPLHFNPEATVDYWVDDVRMVDQETMVENIVRDASGVFFLIKEHPAMYFRRNTRFYERLLSHSNVALLHPYDVSNRVLAKVNNVAVFTGSIGVEALIRNKRVLSFSKNYYSDLHPNVRLVKKIDAEVLSSELLEYDATLFVKDLLKGLYKAKFLNNTSILESDLGAMSEYARQFLKQRRDETR